MWLFDTSFIINLFEHRKNALAKAEEVDLSPARKHISIITVHEVLRGVYYLYQGSTLNKKLNLTEMALGKFTTLPYLHPIAKQAARLDADLAKKRRDNLLSRCCHCCYGTYLRLDPRLKGRAFQTY
jgi:tRNA(fMet)-specific endonuclease VapC